MTKGPLRLVVESFVNEIGTQQERLECGHIIHRKQDAFGYYDAKRRRCRHCKIPDVAVIVATGGPQRHIT